LKRTATFAGTTSRGLLLLLLLLLLVI